MATQRTFYTSTICLLTLLTFSLDCSAASQDILPHPCDTVKCPPTLEMTCPEDSDVRESISSIALLTATPTEESAGYNTSEIADDLYAQCCLLKKCLCKTCYIPDCHGEGEVVVELIPEAMETPGHCCGQYECHREPNCTEVRDTESYWLTNCQRCKCYSGERMCHQSCDEGMKKPTAICNSKTLNKFFEHGESWKDGCYECECVNGEEKCVMPFCKSVNCPPHRQVLLKDSCCPICWPKGIEMPNGDFDDDNDDDDGDDDDEDTQAAASGAKSDHGIYDDDDDNAVDSLPHPTDDYAENEIDTLPNINFDNDVNATSATTNHIKSTTLGVERSSTTKTTTTTTTTTQAPQTFLSAGGAAAASSSSSSIRDVFLSSSTTTATPPCMLDGARNDAPATYQVYPEVFEVVRQPHQNVLFYVIIAFLAIVTIVLLIWNIQLRAKQRSYRPVSNFDDNFNKMSSNIKKTNDYV